MPFDAVLGEDSRIDHGATVMVESVIKVETDLIPKLCLPAGCVAVCCSVVQCGAVCCSVVQCGAVWCSVVQCGAV